MSLSDIATLQAHLTHLEQENETLRSRLHACERSYAVVQAELADYRRREHYWQKITDGSMEHRLLEAIATAANVLLTRCSADTARVINLDEAVNTALQIIGETLETDRLAVTENFAPQADASLPHWRVLYEWDSPNTVSQIAHPDVAQGSWEGIEAWYERLSQGHSISSLLAEHPESFRSGQAELGVKALHTVPIFVEGKHWGQLGFDDCREVKRRGSAELSMLKIAADCIGSAIQRDRTQQALLQAEQARSIELERHNIELQQTLDHLSDSEQRFQTLFELSSEGFYYAEVDPPCPINLPIEEQCDHLYRNIQVVKANPAFAAMYGVNHPDELIGLRNADVHVSGSEKNVAFIRGMIANGYRFQNLETEEVDKKGRRRYFLNSGVSTIQDGFVISAWSTQIDITELRETQQALLEAEQARSQELTQANEELHQRDRLLSVVAQITKDLLETEDVERAIPTALQAVGEAANISRVQLLLERPDPATGVLQHEITYEWAADGITPQLDHPNAAVLDNDDFEFMVRELHLGHSIWRVVADFPDPIRSIFESFGIKSSGTVPIFIEGRYIGGVGFDDCITSRHWSQHEIDVLTAAADSIGAALHRKQLVDRLIAERIQAEQERTTELTKANDALKQTVDVLATETNLDRFLGQVLRVIAEQLEAPLAEYWYHPEPNNIAYVGLTYWQGQILTPEQQPGHVGASGYPVPPEMIQQESLHHRRSHFMIDDMVTSPIYVQIANEYGLDAGAWYGSRGVRSLLNIPLILGDKTIGALIVFFPGGRHFTEQQIELAYALAQQVTLAIQLTLLSEEAKQAAIFEERNRMAGEIHDTMAQAFTGISMQLSVAKWLIQQDPGAVDEILDRINEIAQSGLAEARRSVWTLYPVDQVYADLAQQLSNCVKQMTSGTPMQVDVQISGSPCSLAPMVGKNLLRIGQEAITNTLKHAQATNLNINLIYTEQSLCLRIQDDGCGFLTDLDRSGFGLISMSDRADRINGQLTIDSQPGEGTTICIQVPLP